MHLNMYETKQSSLMYKLLKLSKLLFLTLSLTACASKSINHKIPLNKPLSKHAFDKSKFVFSDKELTSVKSSWWNNFDDPSLTKLVELALSNNRDLATAEANIQAASTAVRVARLDRSISIGSSASIEAGRLIGAADTFQVNRSGNIGASWELDAFGRVKASIKAAEYSRESFIETKRDIAVLIASQTAQAYIDLRGAKARLLVAKRNANLQRQSLSLIKLLVINGQSSDLDLHRAEAQYRSTLALIPTFKADSEVAATQISALTGTPVNVIMQLYAIELPANNIPLHNGSIVTSSPSELLSRRPDIRQAFAKVANQLALSDVERTRLYPTFTFNTNLDALFGSTGSSITRNIGLGFGPNISWEGPDLRRVRADIDASESLAYAAFSNYEQTILNAVADVESTLTRYNRELERRDDLRSALASARKALELAKLRYEEGVDDFLDVLEAQATLLTAEDELTLNTISITTNAIDAYRALGGMWTNQELANTSNALITNTTNNKTTIR